MKQLLQKPFILFFIILLALGLIIFKVKSKPAISHEILTFPNKTVEIIEVKLLPFRTQVVGYGNVKPTIEASIKAEVSGKISYIHPALKKGGSLNKGTVVLRIESTTFKFSLDQNSAGLEASKSSLTQLKVEENATRTSLITAQKNLQVGQKELKRQQSILSKKLISRSVVDAEEQKVLQLRQQVEDLQGKLTAYTSRKAATQAQIEQSKSQLAQSQDTLGRTEVVIPFDARIGEVSIEKGGFTSVGNILFEVSGIEAVEINAQLPTRQFRPLLLQSTQKVIPLQKPTDLKSAISKLNLKVVVSLVGFEGIRQEWQASLKRIAESIDPTRDTIGLVVSIKNPYVGVIPGIRPPLIKGMYASVKFIAPQREAIIIPRKALHQGRVYIATSDNKLEIRKVGVAYKQGNLVVINEGLNPGEQLIITDVVPVIEGQPLTLILASHYAVSLAEEALGNSDDGDQL